MWSSVQYFFYLHVNANKWKLCPNTRNSSSFYSARLKISQIWVFFPGKWYRTSKETDKRRRMFPKIAQIAQGNAYNASASSALPSLRKSDRQEDKSSKIERQTIDCRRYGCCVLTHRKTGGSCSQKTVEVGGFVCCFLLRRQHLLCSIPPICLHNKSF